MEVSWVVELMQVMKVMWRIRFYASSITSRSRSLSAWLSLAMMIFNLSKSFPKEETYSLTDQVRRASRSVCTNIAEAWRKRRYKAAFISKLSDAETEAAEVQVWLEFAVACEYTTEPEAEVLAEDYGNLLGSLVGMIHHADKWCLPARR
jgi:four helix bundle protein